MWEPQFLLMVYWEAMCLGHWMLLNGSLSPHVLKRVFGAFVIFSPLWLWSKLITLLINFVLFYKDSTWFCFPTSQKIKSSQFPVPPHLTPWKQPCIHISFLSSFRGCAYVQMNINMYCCPDVVCILVPPPAKENILTNYFSLSQCVSLSLPPSLSPTLHPYLYLICLPLSPIFSQLLQFHLLLLFRLSPFRI